VARDHIVTAHDGIALAARDHGRDGPPLILIHGAGMNLLSVERLARELNDLRVVTFDARWCGQSGDSAVYDWDDLVRDVESVRDQLELGNPVVAGHSWGGMIAARYGVANPDAAAVVNIDGHGPGDPSRWEGIERDEVDAFIERMASYSNPFEGKPDQGDREWLPTAREDVTAYYRALGMDEDEAAAYADRNFVVVGEERWRRHPNLVLFSGVHGDLKLFDVYRQVRAPLLIFNCAGHMPFLTADTIPFMDAMRRSMKVMLGELTAEHPNIRAATLDQVDHSSATREHAGVVAEEIQSFLRDIGVTGARG
jgi:pimeloyl-ACP methyl ester carboxylesterase